MTKTAMRKTTARLLAAAGLALAAGLAMTTAGGAMPGSRVITEQDGGGSGGGGGSVYVPGGDIWGDHNWVVERNNCGVGCVYQSDASSAWCLENDPSSECFDQVRRAFLSCSNACD